MYFTNHQNVEKALLGRENLQQTVRLILNNAFTQQEPELTKLFQGMLEAFELDELVEE